jgi:hypothetical protein
MPRPKRGGSAPPPTYRGKGPDFATALDRAATNARRGKVADGAILDVVRIQVRVSNPHVGEYFVDVG